MYGDKTKAKERVGKKASAVHKAIMNMADKNYAKQGIKEAAKRIVKK